MKTHNKSDIARPVIPLLSRFRIQLLILVLLAFVPALILAIHNNLNERRTRLESIRDNAIGAASLAAARQEKFIENADHLLATLSHFSFLVSNHDRAFTQAHLANLRLLSPEYLDFGLIETNGKLFCSTVVTNRVMDLSNWSCFARAVRTLRFSVGDLETNRTTRQETLDFAYPILNDKGKLSRVLFACLDLSRLRDAIGEIQLPKSAVISILDRRGHVLAQHPEKNANGKFNGKAFMDAAQAAHVLKGKQSVFEMTDSDHVEKLFAVASLQDGTGDRLWVSVGIPTETAFAAADRELWRNIGIMACVAVLALAIAYVFAERAFLRPLHSLMSEARLLAAGKWSERAETSRGKGELGELSRTFKEMAVTLEKQRADIQAINADLEQRVKDRTLELEQASRELEAFSYSVSHDLRAPLRHISGFVDLLRNELGEAVSEKGRRYLNILDDSARQMGQLIDELLVFSKMGRVEMRKAIVNANDLVEETITKLQPEIRDRKIVWEKCSLPELQGDPAMLRQVFVNLISNAIKYSSTRDAARIQIGHEKNEHETIIFVRDNGVGFDMQFADKLFGVFQRLHRADEFEGTGIGLANVRRIIQRHGGRTWAEGKVDQGATFYFSMPIINGKQL